MVCSLAIGFSISVVIGTTFNSVIMLVPFILLGVGVDDMIILVDTYDNTPMPDRDDVDDAEKGRQRLGNAMAASGLSISLTSFCSTMAFFVGSATDIPGIHAFCVYAAFSFLANYVMQFMLFVPLMVIDDRRIRRKGNFCCPCFQHKQTYETPTDNPKISRWSIKYLLPRMISPIMSTRLGRIVVILAFLCSLSGSL